MFPTERLAPDAVERSALHERLIVVLASPESGADLVVEAIGRLTGVVACPVRTNIFSSGMSGLLDSWIAGDGPEYGLASLADAQELLWAARRLADELLAPVAVDGHYLIEYSPPHIRAIDAVTATYPDAWMLHIVRDGRDVAGRLASRDRETFFPSPAPPRSGPGWLARAAAQSWCDDQRSVEVVAGSPNLFQARIEKILADPLTFLAWFGDAIGIATTDDMLHEAADALGGGNWTLTKPRMGRAQAMVELLGRDLLEEYEYPAGDLNEILTAVGRVELALAGLGGRVDRVRLKLAEQLRTASEGLKEPKEGQAP